MKKIFTILTMLMLFTSGVWAYSTVTFTSAQDSKGNALESGGFYRILLPSRSGSVALQQNGDYVKANNGYGIIGFMWKMEADANGKALISNPSGGYWKFTDYNEGNSKLKTNGTSSDCTAFQMAWSSSANKTLNLFDPTNGTYSYGGVLCGTVLSNHGGVGNNMGIYNNILDGGSIFKFERFYRTVFVFSEDVNGVAVGGNWQVTINGSISASEYYTNSDNQITSFSTAYAAKYYIGGVEKTAEEVKTAINANTGDLTVTVKPQPFVASTNASPAYYAMMISGNANSWWENTNGTVVNCGANRAFPAITDRNAWIWQLIQDGTNGYRIYSVDADKYLGGRTSTGGAFTLGAVDAANSFKCEYYSGAQIKFKDYTNNLWIDRASVNSISQPYAHTSGQQFTFLRMYKVTFSEGVAVNGGSDVTTMYVKGDGSDSFTLPDDKLYSIDGGETLGNTDAATAIAACTSNITVTVSANTQKSVTYTLKWSDGTTISSIDDVSTYKYTLSSTYLPSSMANDFVTLDYSPTEIGDDTDEVTVTATWNGPFELSTAFGNAKWYTVGIHKYYEGDNYIWKYDGTNTVSTEKVATNDYSGVTDARLFCFVGNPYTGFTIYNKAAGSSLMLTRADDQTTEATMSSTATLFVPKTSSTGTIADGYFCLLPKNGTNYINMQNVNTSTATLKGWDDNDSGSTCWVIAPSQYPLNFLNAQELDAPYGAVGTKYGLTEPEYVNAGGFKTYFESNAFDYATLPVDQRNSVDAILDKLAAGSVITLGNGYYRIVSAVPGFNNTAAWYYNPAASTTHIVWARAATTAEHQINSIFKFTANGDKWNIYSPNAQQYITTGNGTWNVQNAQLGTADGLTVTSIGSAQYTFLQASNAQTLHAGGHNNGNGTSGNLITWNSNGLGEASAWYILPVGKYTITLNAGGDGNYYATMYLPFDVTISGATAYTLEKSGDWLVPTAVTDNKVPAGTPVMLKGSNATATATINLSTAFSTENSNSLTGTYVDMPVTKTDGVSNDYFLGIKDDVVGFYKWTGTTLKANRAYYQAPSSANGFAIVWDEATGIRTIDNGQLTIDNDQWYTLDGRRLNGAPTKAGIYIVNGKKVAIK